MDGTDSRTATPERIQARAATVFRDLITGSNSNGHQFICRGEFEVIIERIPEDAPTDWAFGPKMKPGEFGAYRAHGFYACGHGNYAFAVGKDAATCEEQARGHFAGKFVCWPRLTAEDRLAGKDALAIAPVALQAKRRTA